MDYHVKPVSKFCESTGNALPPGGECWSVLVAQGGTLVRQDYSLEAWQGPPEGAIGYWKAKVPQDSGSSRQRLDADALFDYFSQLTESPNSAQLDYVYVLALLLLRKKRLILEETTQEDDQTVMHLVGSAGEGPFLVRERELSDEQIVRLQEQLFAAETTGEAA